MHQVWQARATRSLQQGMPVLAIHSRKLTIPKIGEHSLPSWITLCSYLTQHRIPENCAFTTQHASPEEAQVHGPSPIAGFGMPNGGLQVVNPSKAIYDLIIERMSQSSVIENYEFADQSLLGDLFRGRWVALPYIYNALKTIRWKDVHSPIWQDDKVKNVHYILSPKPWDEARGGDADPTHEWWWKMNDERLAEEKAMGLMDGF